MTQEFFKLIQERPDLIYNYAGKSKREFRQYIYQHITGTLLPVSKISFTLFKTSVFNYLNISL